MHGWLTGVLQATIPVTCFPSNTSRNYNLLVHVQGPNQSELKKCQYGSGSPRSLLCCPPVSIVTIIRIIHEKTTAGIVAFANSPKSVIFLFWFICHHGLGLAEDRLIFLILMIGVGENPTKTGPFCLFILYWKDSPSSEISVWRTNKEMAFSLKLQPVGRRVVVNFIIGSNPSKDPMDSTGVNAAVSPQFPLITCNSSFNLGVFLWYFQVPFKHDRQRKIATLFKKQTTCILKPLIPWAPGFSSIYILILLHVFGSWNHLIIKNK